MLQELQHPNAPVSVSRWIAFPPSWLVPHEIDCGLDPGEREAIALAQDNHVAAESGLLELSRALEALLGTNFHVSSKIIQRLLDGDLERKRAGR